jgi:hypothetical protein
MPMVSASPYMAGLGLLLMPLDAAIGQVFTPYHSGGCHGHQFWHTQLSCGVVKSLSDAIIKNAQHKPKETGVQHLTNASKTVKTRFYHMLSCMGSLC